MASVLPGRIRAASGGFRNFWRAVRQLFYEAAGTLFALFAVEGLWMIWRQWKFSASPAGPDWWLIIFAAAYALAMAAFAVDSFRRARRIR